jgi:formate/nitrite transporter FocA (FNT family)
MSEKRRITIIIASVFFGMFLSYLVYKLKRGGAELSNSDVTTLATNFVFSIAIIIGVGYMFIWKKKKDL